MRSFLKIYFSLQGASARYPSFYCLITQTQLKNHGASQEEHNFNTIECCQRTFESLENDLGSQISELTEDFGVGDNFIETVVESDNHTVERQFRDKGKNHHSVIGRNNTGIPSMDFALGKFSKKYCSGIFVNKFK